MTGFETYIVQGDGLSVDAIIWQRYQRRTPKLVEQTLDLNPGLAELGPTIPHGTVVRIPRLAPPAERQVSVIRLWD